MKTTKKILWRNYLPLCVILFLVLLASCEKEDVAPAANDNSNAVSTREVNELKSFLVEATGTELTKIKFDEAGQTFVIDNDVVMSLKNAREHFAKSKLGSSDQNGRTEQRRYTFIMSNAVAETVSIYVGTDVPAVWITAVDQAIANWNNADSRISAFRTTNPAGARIGMGMSTTLPSNVIAQASFPDAAGNNGPTVVINPAFNGLSASQKQFAITHEFGHCFGFTHTNQTFGNVIADTPVLDPNSVLNSVVLNWNGFTFYDFIAYGVVYPKVAGTRRFLRYYNNNNGDHFYTTATGELGAGGSGGWISERGVGYIYTSAVAGTVSLYRYYNKNSGDHFYTTNFAELGGGGGAWIYEGVAGYVSPTNVAGTKPLYRYYNNNNGDHFYTPNFGELGFGGGSWIYEGVQCYIW